MISELTAACSSRFADAPGLRAVVLTGEGKIFCAGADVSWMRPGGWLLGPEENPGSDARRMARTLRTIDTRPRPVIGSIGGAAIGGGVGAPLPSATSRSPPAERCSPWRKSSSGILPAAISPYVLRAIGPRGTPATCSLTGGRSDAGGGPAHRTRCMRGRRGCGARRRGRPEDRRSPDIGAGSGPAATSG